MSTFQNFAEEAVRQEREAIARMLEHDAATHEMEATDLERDYGREADEEAAQHRSDAYLLQRMADKVRARSLGPRTRESTNPPEQVVIPDDEIRF